MTSPVFSPFAASPIYPNPYQLTGLGTQKPANTPGVQFAAPDQVILSSPGGQPASPMPPHPGYNWSMPSQWVNSARTLGGNVRDELQKTFPGEYAHLIGWQPVKDVKMNLKEASHAVTEVAQHRPVKDHELITFDDDMKRAGSIGIATLATIGLRQGIFGVGEYLGMASWFGAMAATPKLINLMARAKTGVNLNQKYDSTEGQRLNLYQDPNYQPLHLLTKEQEDLAAQKLHIPDGPNRRREIENKIRQVSVQAHTWGMLAAGFATPVISGLTCDLLQDPAMRGINRLKEFKYGMEANRLGHASKVDHDKLADQVKGYMNQVIGEAPESELSSWWKGFGQGLVRKAGLMKIDTSVITKKSRIDQREALTNQLAELAQPGNGRLEKVKAFLDKQFAQREENGEDIFSGRIQQIEDKANKFLNGFKDSLDEEHYKAEEEKLQTRIINAKSSIGHYRQIFGTIEAARKQAGDKPLSEAAMTDLKAEIDGRLRAPSTQRLQGLLMNGQLEQAKKLVGKTDTFKLINTNLDDTVRKGETASKLMGAAPETHLLDDALKSAKLGRMWRTRMGLFVGGGILAATAVYNYTMVGRDFQKPAPLKPVPQPAGGQQ